MSEHRTDADAFANALAARGDAETAPVVPGPPPEPVHVPPPNSLSEHMLNTAEHYARGERIGTLQAARGAAGAAKDAVTRAREAPAGPAPTTRATVAGRPRTGKGLPPVKTGASGAAALKALAVIATSKPYAVEGGPLGTIVLVPGSSLQGRIILSAGPLETYYIDGVDVWEAYTPDLVRDPLLSALSQGAATAQWLIPLAQAEFAFFEAIVAPWYLVGGVAVLEAAEFYHRNSDQIHKATAAITDLYSSRGEFKLRYPTLYDTLFYGALREVGGSLLDGVTLADAAYLIGRILGFQGIHGAFLQGIEVTGKVIAKIVLEYVALVTVVHAPGIVGRAAVAAAQSHLAPLKAAFANAGISVSDEHAARIVQELAADPGTPAFLQRFGVKAETAAKAVELVLKGRGH